MTPAGEPHGHDWQALAFELDRGHPVMVQSCACGLRRTIRAWEAYWDPGGPPTAHPAHRAVAAGTAPPDPAPDRVARR